MPEEILNQNLSGSNNKILVDWNGANSNHILVPDSKM